MNADRYLLFFRLLTKSTARWYRIKYIFLNFPITFSAFRIKQYTKWLSRVSTRQMIQLPSISWTTQSGKTNLLFIHAFIVTNFPDISFQAVGKRAISENKC